MIVTFEDVKAVNPPLLAIVFKRGPSGEELFEWGTVKYIPILSLIGAIVEAQRDLVSNEYIPECDRPAFVIALDETDQDGGHMIKWFTHPDIPIHPLVGVLEVIKSMLVDSRLAQVAGPVNRVSVLGPDGHPMRG